MMIPLTRITSVALLIASVAALSILMGCGDDEPATCSTCGVPDNDLVFTRANSSEIDFPASAKTYVWCGDWEPDEVEVPALHIWFSTMNQGDPGWYLRAVLADIEIDEPLSFPITFIWNEPEGVHIFLNDSPNELATDTEDASGTITFHALPCSGGNTVEFSIDAVLGSEFGDMPSVAVTGSFTGYLAPPPWDTETDDH